MNIFDGIISQLANTGNPLRDKLASSFFVKKTVSDVEIEALYQSWMGQKIVEIPAHDALRQWRAWHGRDAQLVEGEEKRIDLKRSVLQAKILARLYGGAVLFIGLSDRRPTEEVKLSSIRKGGLEHVTPLSRKEVFLGELETDPLSKNYGCPKCYIVGATGGAIKIHPSRIVKFIGNHNGTSGWGESVLVSSYDDIRRATAAADNISNLLFESTINIYKVPNLITSLGAAGKEYEDLILKRFGLTSATKGILGDIVIDKEEDFDRKSTSFAQLPEILEKFWLAVAASEDIPVTRFLGQSPAGLNSTGEGDAQNYLDKLKAIQELDIAPALAGLDEILIRSATGGRDNELGFSWNPIRRADESNLVSLAREEAVMLGTINGLNVFTAEEMRKIAQAVLIARKIPGASEIA